MKINRREFVITTAFIANEVITLSTGGGSGSGASTASKDSVTLNTSEALMNADNTCRVTYNGVEQNKGSGKDVVWNSTTTMHFIHKMDIGDIFAVERVLK